MHCLSLILIFLDIFLAPTTGHWLKTFKIKQLASSSPSHPNIGNRNAKESFAISCVNTFVNEILVILIAFNYKKKILHLINKGLTTRTVHVQFNASEYSSQLE